MKHLYEETHALNYKEVLFILLQQLFCMGDTSFLDPSALIGQVHFLAAFKIKDAFRFPATQWHFFFVL